jgi:hypothetical protein
MLIHRGAVAHFQRAIMIWEIGQAAQAIREAEIEGLPEGFTVLVNRY